jgi:hypothetical protein
VVPARTFDVLQLQGDPEQEGERVKAAEARKA